MSTNMSILDDNILLDDGEMMRHIRLYDPSLREFDPMVAYLYGDYYYIYRGTIQSKEPSPDEPGIYMNEATGKPILFEPSTDEEKEKYSYGEKIMSSTVKDLVNQINNRQVQVFILPEATKSFCPELSPNDDMLKRIMKQAIISKAIDLERYKHRFIDKNALFNFKQVLKGDSRLSMLLFDRGVEAFNLKYTIIVEEADGGETIGARLEEPIVMHSDDTFDIKNIDIKNAS